MRALLGRYWRAAPLATVILLLALAAALVFGARMAVHSAKWRAADRPVAAWMTPGFIGHAYHIPREVVLEALAVPDPPPKRAMTLEELARYRDVPVDTVLDEVRTLIAENPSGDRPSQVPGTSPEVPER